MLFYQDKVTKLLPGDIIVLDTEGEMVHFKREGNMLMQEDDDLATYWALPADGVQLHQTAKMIAAACGLRIEEVKGEDFPTYQLL